MEGHLWTGLVADGAARILVVDVTGPANHTRLVHQLEADAAVVAAEALAGAGLLVSHLKGDERVTLQLNCSMPRLTFIADVDANGVLRARMDPAALVGAAAGRFEGLLLTIKSLPGRELYRGVTELTWDTLGEALARHLDRSSQVDAALVVGAEVDADGNVTAAGGVLVERFPEEPGRPSMSPEAFQAAFGGLRSRPISDVAAELAGGRLAGEKVVALEGHELVWRCRCGRERVSAMLAGLGEHVLRELIDEDHGAEVTCDFCRSGFRFDEAELSALLPT